MRIIKFRIWCKVSNKYHYNWIKHVEQTDDDLLVWEQFTGLLDKEGREIYEGDIIKCIGIGAKFEEELTGMVFFQDAEYCIDTNHCKWPVASFHVLKNKEIIGNIHENSNILN